MRAANEHFGSDYYQKLLSNCSVTKNLSSAAKQGSLDSKGLKNDLSSISYRIGRLKLSIMSWFELLLPIIRFRLSSISCARCPTTSITTRPTQTASPSYAGSSSRTACTARRSSIARYAANILETAIMPGPFQIELN